MGYLPKNSFMIFLDSNAPTELKTISSEEIAEIESKHNEAKGQRIESLIKGEVPAAGYGWQRVESLVKECSQAAEDCLREIVNSVQEFGTYESEFEDYILTTFPSVSEIVWRDFVGVVQEVVVSEPSEAKSQRVESLVKEGVQAEEDRLREIVQRVQEIGTDENAFQKYINTTFPSTSTQGWRDLAWAVHKVVVREHNKAETQRVESLVKEGAQAEEERSRAIVQRVQEIGTNESALKEYIRTTFPSTSEMKWRDFAWAVHEIVISKATLPDNRYVPQRTSESTVRFWPDGYLGVNVALTGTQYDDENKVQVADGSTQASLWVKVVEGWARDGNWGGYLQISCRTEKGKYLDSRNGWVTPVTSGQDKVTFYDMGNYYEIWQKDRESGRPLTVEGGCLRFTAGATPGKWNLQNSTWD